MPKIRQHVNPLKSDLMTIAEVPRVQASAGRFLEVELGSAEAQFLIERAPVAVDALLVGVELRREMVVRADRLCAEAGVTGVRNVFANISVDLPRLFAPRSVRRFHINFPDPWFKSRQHKRRVVGPALVEQLAELLEAGGEVSVMTDIFDIALEAMAVLESHEAAGVRFINARAPWSFWVHNPWQARSRRERQCELEGQRIWRLIYRKADGVPAASTGDGEL